MHLQAFDCTNNDRSVAGLGGSKLAQMRTYSLVVDASLTGAVSLPEPVGQEHSEHSRDLCRVSLSRVLPQSCRHLC